MGWLYSHNEEAKACTTRHPRNKGKKKRQISFHIPLEKPHRRHLSCLAPPLEDLSHTREGCEKHHIARPASSYLIPGRGTSFLLCWNLLYNLYAIIPLRKRSSTAKRSASIRLPILNTSVMAPCCLLISLENISLRFRFLPLAPLPYNLHAVLYQFISFYRSSLFISCSRVSASNRLPYNLNLNATNLSSLRGSQHYLNRLLRGLALIINIALFFPYHACQSPGRQKRKKAKTSGKRKLEIQGVNEISAICLVRAWHFMQASYSAQIDSQRDPQEAAGHLCWSLLVQQ